MRVFYSISLESFCFCFLAQKFVSFRPFEYFRVLSSPFEAIFSPNPIDEAIFWLEKIVLFRSFEHFRVLSSPFEAIQGDFFFESRRGQSSHSCFQSITQKHHGRAAFFPLGGRGGRRWGGGGRAALCDVIRVPVGTSASSTIPLGMKFYAFPHGPFWVQLLDQRYV